MIKLCILASGSSGNCIFAGTATTRILIDAGLSARATAARLASIGESLAGLQGVCVTHEHSDHIAGLTALQTRAGLPLYANTETIQAICRDESMRRLKWRVFATGSEFTIGDLTLSPFTVPHDAGEPVGFLLRAAQAQVGVVTDLGSCTQLVRERLRACQAVVIESNHDAGMLTDSRRPWSLKQRITGRHGHLSNEAAAELLAEIAHPGLARVFLAHLSKDCNRPDLAVRTVRRALDGKGYAAIPISVGFPDRASDVWEAP